MFRSRRLLDLAEGEPCMNCGAEDGTVVAAHSNLSRHGKGKSIKAHDCFIAFLCHRCHSWLDQGCGMDPTGVWGDSRTDREQMFRHAMDDTMLRLWTSGKVVCK